MGAIYLELLSTDNWELISSSQTASHRVMRQKNPIFGQAKKWVFLHETTTNGRPSFGYWGNFCKWKMKISHLI
jgi:hypothetical protein